MRKILAIAISLVLLLSCLTGCHFQIDPGGDVPSSVSMQEQSDPSADTAATDPSTQPTEPDPFASLPAVFIGDGDVLTLQDGMISVVPLESAEITVSHHGAEITVYYRWGKLKEQIIADNDYTKEALPSYTLEGIGSERYIALTFGEQGAMVYSYLIDVLDQTLLDPLAALDAGIRDSLYEIEFSADARYAIIGYNKGEEWGILECDTGKLTELPGDREAYDLSGIFLDNDRILITTVYSAGRKETNEYIWTIYNIDTGENTDCTKLLDPSAQPRGTYETRFWSAFDSLFYRNHDDSLEFVDLLTGESVSVEWPYGAVQKFLSCGEGQIGVVSDGILFVIDMEGNVTPICKIAPRGAIISTE